MLKISFYKNFDFSGSVCYFWRSFNGLEEVPEIFGKVFREFCDVSPLEYTFLIKRTKKGIIKPVLIALKTRILGF